MLIKYELIQKTATEIDVLIKTFIEAQLADNPGYSLDQVQLIDLKGSRSYLVQVTLVQPVSADIDASQIISGVIDVARLPQQVFEKLTVVADQAAMLALTIVDVQNGDTVKLNDTDVMYFVADDTLLGTLAAFEVYKAGSAASVDWGNIVGTLSNQTDLKAAFDLKVDKDGTKVLSDNNYTTTEKNKLSGIEESADVNVVDSVNSKTGDVVLDPDDLDDAATTNKFVSSAEKSTWNSKEDAIGFTPENVANKATSFQVTPDNTKYPTEKLLKDQLELKVDKDGTKVLSDNNYTDEEVSNLAVAAAIPVINKNPTGFSVPKDVIVTYDSGTTKITLTGTVLAYWRGEVVALLISGWESPALTATYGAPNAGNYYLYYNGTSFVWSTTEWAFDNLLIALVYYKADGTFIFAQRETHGVMPWQSHSVFHDSIGTQKMSGGSLSNYTLDSTTSADRRPDISEALIKDEDLETEILALLSSAKFTQVYLSGTEASPVVNFDIDNDDIVPLNGAKPQYNAVDGGNWSLLDVPDKKFMAVFLILFPASADAASQKKRFLWIPSQTVGKEKDMQSLDIGSLDLSDFAELAPEYVASAKVIMEYKDADWEIKDVIVLTGSRTLTLQQSGGFLTAVTTDDSMSGNGTPADPLSMIPITQDIADASYTLLSTDVFNQINLTRNDVQTISIDTFANQAIPTNSRIVIQGYGSGVKTIESVAGVTLNGVDNNSFVLDAQYSSCELACYATNTWIITGGVN